MPGSTIGTSLNYGFAGNLAYSPDNITVAKPVKTGTANIPFGFAVQLNTDNTVQLAGAATTAATFAGIATGEVKQSFTYPTNPSGGTTIGNNAGAYLPLQPADITQRGIVAVKCNVGTPTAGGAVFVRIAANGAIPAGVVGGFEAAADGANTIAVTNCKWFSGKSDANGITTLRINFPVV
jgi:hypothetical protein